MPDKRFATLVWRDGKGFSALGLKFQQNIFAMLVKGKLVVKLPRASGGCAHRLWRREPFVPERMADSCTSSPSLR